jgi:hypothetical protein
VIKRFPWRRSLLMAALAASSLPVSSSRAESLPPFPAALVGIESVPLLVYVDGGDVLDEGEDDKMGDALERELVRTFQSAGYRSFAWRPTLGDTTHLDIRISAWVLDDVPKKALLVMNGQFFDQGRLAHGPNQPVEVITWSRHESEVIDAKGANRVLEKAIRDTGRDFLRVVTVANGDRKKNGTE